MVKDTLIVIQCCKKKKAVEQYPEEAYSLKEKIPGTYSILEEAITRFKDQGIINDSSCRVTSLSMYRGHFYKVPGVKEMIYNQLKFGNIDFLIMSAGYGFVHPFQRIHDYEQRMQGKVTTYWKRVGLSLVLKEYAQNQQFKLVYGFFSKSSDYKKIFKSAGTNWRISTK